MTLIKNIPYIYGTKSGIFHYGRKVSNISSIEITVNEVIIVNSFLSAFPLSKEIFEITIEEFQKDNFCGFYFDSDRYIYSANDIKIWGIDNDIQELYANWNGIVAFGENIKYTITDKSYMVEFI